MRDFLKTLLGLLLIAGIGFALGIGYARRAARIKPETPIVSKADTSSSVAPIGVEKPKSKDSTVIHHVWVRVPVKAEQDSVPEKADSAMVEIPIERRVYEEDSLYRAVVSGPRIGKAGPSLDSLLIFSKTTTITVTNTVPEYVPDPGRGWGLGVAAGASVLATPSGNVHAGLGVTLGLYYRF